jgi:diguanylate cyclase (GGDEF)-like protein
LNFCVALISVDKFKAINEKSGHLAGDTVLHEFAQFLEVGRRATDTVARYDRTQFALLMAGTRFSTAMVALGQLRNEVAQQD